VEQVRRSKAWTSWVTKMPVHKGKENKSVVRNVGTDTIKTKRKVIKNPNGGAIKKFSPIARPQRFEGVF
jgi:hypothetical protein